jgi:Tfp pilus assembly protein PilO
MIEKFFDKLPYDSLEGVKFIHVVFTAIGLGILLAVGYYFTLYTQNHDEMARLGNKKVELTKKLNRYRKVVGERDFVTKRLALVRGDLDAMKKQMPKEEEMPYLLKRVADMGKGLGLQVLLYEMDDDGGINDYYKIVPVSINFRGGIWKTLDFFDGMQNLLRLVDFSGVLLDVKDVPIFSGDGSRSGSIPMLHTSFTAKTYTYVEGSEDRLPQKKKAKDTNKKNKKKK